jgi:hydrogenase nickel incorporation protein HypA/HybF
MHEVGITQSIIDIAEQHARAQGAGKIHSVTVEIGALSGVIAESVEFCFEACASGTLLEGTRLIIHRIPGLGRCGECGATTPMEQHTFACEACGGFALETLQGTELRVTELEVD